MDQTTNEVTIGTNKSTVASNAETGSAQPDNFFIKTPTVELPKNKGGGAIRGVGESFSSNPVTGAGSMTIPLGVSPGRNGFGPELSLSYNSASGNGPFGYGFSLSLPSISRKTNRGLPRYRDKSNSDVYVISGADDLVSVVNELGEQEDQHYHDDYIINLYQPRVEGSFARIERWVNKATKIIHWRVISKENITSIFGNDESSRISDPANPNRTFQWLLRRSFDNKGNVIDYHYEAENDVNIPLHLSSERNRSRDANRYLKSIKYGNRVSSLLPNWEAAGWLFEVVFDYNEGLVQAIPWDPSIPATEQHHRVRAAHSLPGSEDKPPWSFRPDPFSSYRSGFEIRTYRRCSRVLMFHHFDELTAHTGGKPYLVKSTEFDYRDLDYTSNPDIDEQLAHSGSTRVASFIQRVTQSAYEHDPSADANDSLNTFSAYIKKSLPPIDLTYSKAIIDNTVHRFEHESFKNLPIGLDGQRYRWVDLNNEGISGVVLEQGDALYYKENLGEARFGPLQRLPSKPNINMVNGAQMLADVDGDGRLDIVSYSGAMPGFYSRTADYDWQPFTPLKHIPSIAFDNPNLRFADLTGDGLADICITEDEVITWHESLGASGFKPATQTPQANDEELGPKLVFADGTGSVYLADFCGDGLQDLVRIRNGEVSYWPNLGYGRFGAKVTMDNAPQFDEIDQFDQQRIRLADIDGSGTTDIIYLHKNGAQLYFNQSGNSWSSQRSLSRFPPVDYFSSVQVADLFGNGTACLVWSSEASTTKNSPLRYIDLMGGVKPHLLIGTNNNLGTETEVHYAPSTKFYLADKAAGKPWITRIPFPVHCVEKVTVKDRWRQTEFSTTTSYHHGYYDGVERTFCGFGRVETLDSEYYGNFQVANANSPYVIGADHNQLHQPPVKTITWYHTGVMLNRRKILSQMAQEYFPNAVSGSHTIANGFFENPLPEPDLAQQSLTIEEWREALHACKGMAMRQEVYELDMEALAQGQQRAVKLFSAANHNCHIRKLQSKGRQRHAVFLVTESEAISYHYELDLKQTELEPDPRITHSVNLNVDEYGNALQTLAIVYPRRGGLEVEGINAQEQARINAVQRELHIAYSEARFTNDVSRRNHYRTRAPCEQKAYELTLNPTSSSSVLTGLLQQDYFTLSQLRRLDLSDHYSPLNTDNVIAVEELAYHQLATGGAQKRLVEHTRTLMFDDNLVNPLPFGQLNHLGLAFETYKLALTDGLIEKIFDSEKQTYLRPGLADPNISGYLSGTQLTNRFPDAEGQYWVRSGIAGFNSDAPNHFYLPERYTDAFGNTSTLQFDALDLFIQASQDPVKNQTRIVEFNFRVLAPAQLEDINGNHTLATYDVLGLPVATALMGKPGETEGDHLGPFFDSANPEAALRLRQPPTAAVQTLFTNPYSEPDLVGWLSTATARQLYWFGEVVNSTTGEMTYEHSPASGCGIQREVHSADLPSGEQSTVQVVFEYTDGNGNILVAKHKAEPEEGSEVLRFLENGRTLLNNKGKPVMQFEPAFSVDEFGEPNHRFSHPDANGVSPIMFYDAVGRVVRTELPDGTYSKAEFSPWHASSFDPSDTAFDEINGHSDWYRRRTDLSHPRFSEFNSAQNAEAAAQTRHHSNTPATVVLDTLGREVISIQHNRSGSAGAYVDEKYVTHTKLDAEGKPLWIRDARNNLVMQYIFPPVANNASSDPSTGFTPCYDIAGNLLFQHSMDAGPRWMLMGADGQPLYAWDANEIDGSTELQQRIYRTEYDELRRPINKWLSVNGGIDEALIEKLEYRDPKLGLGTGSDAFAIARNLGSQVYKHYDPSGLLTNEQFDFKGNLLATTKTLAAAYDAPIVDWQSASTSSGLDADLNFTQRTEYDALNRMTRLYNWHRSATYAPVYEPQYNARGLLLSEELIIGADTTVADGDKPYTVTATQRSQAITNIRYNQKGQRTQLSVGNSTTTTYQYDAETFRLRLLETSGFSKMFQSLTYTYDAVGNITHLRDSAQQTAFFNNSEISPDCFYQYDAINRLIQARGREHAAQNTIQRDNTPFKASTTIPFRNSPEALQRYRESYYYDSVGNILSFAHHSESAAGSAQLHWQRCYQYAVDSNRLLATGARSDFASTCPNHYVESPTLSQPYHHDTHGNMLNLTRTTQEFNLHWDYRDMIHHVNLRAGGGDEVWYNYDSEKQRTRKRREKTNEIEERIYLGGMELYRRWPITGGPKKAVEIIETHHLFTDDQRVLIVDDVLLTDKEDLGTGKLFRYQYGNHLGSVGLELNQKAEVISYEEYHPYGTTAYQANNQSVRATSKRYKYTGMERDEETGLGYHTARYYLPWLGRWGSVDPIGLIGGINFYNYCLYNPISNEDSSGKIPGGTSFRDENERRLFGNWRYGEQVTNRHDIGVNVQRHHPVEVMGRKAQRTSPSGMQYYNRSISQRARELTILVETGRGRFHTEVNRSLRPISRRIRSGELTSESEIILEVRRVHYRTARRLGVPLDRVALDRSILSQQAVLHRAAAETLQELEAADLGPTTVTDETIETAIAPSNPQSPRSRHHVPQTAGASGVTASGSRTRARTRGSNNVRPRRGGAATVGSMLFVIGTAFTVHALVSTNDDIERLEVIIDEVTGWGLEVLVGAPALPVVAFMAASQRNYTEAHQCEEIGPGVCLRMGDYISENPNASADDVNAFLRQEEERINAEREVR